jgi:oligopeptide/dipeptide ABC transporter ATP-binding protein
MVLKLEGVCISTKYAAQHLVGPISFEVKAGEIFGIVGESGSGKTLTGLAIPRLLPRQLSISGQIALDGQELTVLTEHEMRQVRGRLVTVIFQEPASALNPVFTVGEQIEAVVRANTKLRGQALKDRMLELLRRVGIPDPEQRSRAYPHQFSGGMCQRVMIAMALASGARLLIADEPTTALDVTIQAQIVDLLLKLAAEEDLTVIFVSHDLGLIAETCDRIAVFYAGQVVEVGTAADIIYRPRHPYTAALVGATPDMSEVGVLLQGIPGQPPLAGRWPEGCRFRNRCPHAHDRCVEPQALREVDNGRGVRCVLVDDVGVIQ